MRHSPPSGIATTTTTTPIVTNSRTLRWERSHFSRAWPGLHCFQPQPLRRTKAGRPVGNMEFPIMKRLIHAVAIALAVSAPLAAHAQSNPPLTRAQVHAEVKALKQAGFQPSDWFYPPKRRSPVSRVPGMAAIAARRRSRASKRGLRFPNPRDRTRFRRYAFTG
jgi:hypothetical protein